MDQVITTGDVVVARGSDDPELFEAPDLEDAEVEDADLGDADLGGTGGPDRVRASSLADVLTLAVPALIGLMLRAWEVTVGRPQCDSTQLAAGSQACLRIMGDMGYFRGQAHYLAKGHGYVNTVALTVGKVRPGAYHPPAFPTVLGGFNLVGLRSLEAHRLGLSVLGAAGIIAIGLVARRLGGRHGRLTGCVAATLVALSPLFWLNDTQAMSESVYVPLVAGLIAALYGFWRSPTARRAALVGLLVGLITLTRAEGISMLALMLPLLWGMRVLRARVRLGLLGVAIGATLLVLAPWVAHNLTRFPNPTLVTTSAGDALIFRSCDSTFYGRSVGYYDNDCDPKPNLTSEDESAQDLRSRQLALDYIKANAGRLPVVVAARIGRVWEVYLPFDNAQLSGFLDNRGATEARLALYSFWLMLVPAGYGAVCLRRRHIALSPLLGMLVLVTISTAMTSAVVRYRASADLALLILAAVGLAEFWSRQLREPVVRAVAATRPAGRLGLVVMMAIVPLVAPPATPAPRTRSGPAAVSPPGCERSDSLMRLYDAFDDDAAAEPAAKLRRGAPPRIAAEIDAVLATHGDIIRIDPTDLRSVVQDLGGWANDKCSLFGTAK